MLTFILGMLFGTLITGFSAVNYHTRSTRHLLAHTVVVVSQARIVGKVDGLQEACAIIEEEVPQTADRVRTLNVVNATITELTKKVPWLYGNYPTVSGIARRD